MLSSVCGIKPADIGFNKVKITPHLGRLTTIDASMPHPKGWIRLKYEKSGDQFKADISLPEGMSGSWSYLGETRALKEGKNVIEIPLTKPSSG